MPCYMQGFFLHKICIYHKISLGDEMKKISFAALLTSFIISLSFIVGSTIENYGSIRYLVDSNHFVGNFIDFLVHFIVWYFIIIAIFKLLKRKTTINNKVFKFIFNDHPLLMVFILLFLIGLPIVVTFYPGPVQWDGMWQLNYYSGVLPWSNHHPIFSTYILGTVQKIGSIIANDNFGIFLFTFTQYTLSCFIFANIIDFQNKLGTSDIIKLLTFLFFALSPSWYLYAYTFMKDTSYYLIFIIFFINYIKFFYNESDKKSIIILLISSLFLILIRNNGIYVVSVSFLALCFLKPDYKKTSISFVVLFFIVQLILNTIIKINGIEPSNIRETLSIPVQQIARYTIYNNLTEEEKEKISKVFMYDENDFALNYNPDISDPIKESLVIETKSDLKEFLSLWWSLLKKDPVTYIDATLNNTYGYFYPYKEDVKESIGYFRVVNNKRINKGNFDFYMNRKYKSFRKGFEENFYHLRRSEYIKFIYNTGTYFIVLIIILGYSLYIKRYDYLVISIPLLLTYAFCILSPVNAYLRYMNPIIVCLPIMISLVTSTKYNKN